MSVTRWTVRSRSRSLAMVRATRLSASRRCVCLRSRESACLRSVTSRAIFEAPTMTPSWYTVALPHELLTRSVRVLTSACSTNGFPKNVGARKRDGNRLGELPLSHTMGTPAAAGASATGKDILPVPSLLPAEGEREHPREVHDADLLLTSCPGSTMGVVATDDGSRAMSPTV